MKGTALPDNNPPVYAANMRSALRRMPVYGAKSRSM